MSLPSRGTMLAALVALSACSPAEPLRSPAPAAPAAELSGGAAVLSGRVVDAQTGQPLRGAELRMPAAAVSAWTDQAGHFSVPAPTGTYGATVTLNGYRAYQETWTVAEGDGPRLVRLVPDTAMAQALRLVAADLDRRARVASEAPQHWEREALLATTETNTAEFLLDSARLGWALCGGLPARDTRGYTRRLPGRNINGRPGCVRLYGGLPAPCVIVDEQLGSLEGLVGYPPQELYRLEAYRWSATIVAYSNAFVQRLAREGRRLPPVNGLMHQLCDDMP
jgi:carboxypeptidase family protein